MSTTDNTVIHRFDGDNYGLWVTKVTALLLLNDCNEIVDGSEKEPDNTADADVRIKYQRRKQRATALLIRNLSDEVILSTGISGSSPPDQIWTKIHDMYGAKGSLTVNLLRKQYFSLQMKDGEDPIQFISQVQKLVTAIKSAGGEITELDQCYKIISSLPSSLDRIAQSLLDVKDTDMNLKRVINTLMMERTRQGARNSNHDDEIQIARASVKTVVCYNCGIPGHKSNVCKAAKTTCTKCGISGHQGKYCQKRTPGKGKPARVSYIHAMSTKNRGQYTDGFLIDSGAQRHIVSSLDLLENAHSITGAQVMLANNHTMMATHTGDVTLTSFKLHDALFVPDFHVNLISVPQLISCGYSVVFNDNNCFIKRDDGHTVCSVKRDKDAYFVHAVKTQDLQHARNGHLGPTDEFCKICAESKAKQIAVPKKRSGNSGPYRPLQVLHADINGPFNVPSINGLRYVATFIDDATRYTFVSGLKTKDQLVPAFKQLVTLLERQYNCKIEQLQADNGSEFTGSAMRSVLAEHGIVLRTSPPHMQAYNGLAEGNQRTHTQMARAMMIQSNLPKSFWWHAYTAAVYTRNRLPHSALAGSSPYEALKKTPPNLAHLRTFGSDAYVLLPKNQRQKFGPRTKRCIMIGYAHKDGVYQLFNPSTRKTIESINVTFDENSFTGLKSSSIDTKVDIEDIFPVDIEHETINEEPAAIPAVPPHDPEPPDIEDAVIEPGPPAPPTARRNKGIPAAKYGEWMAHSVEDASNNPPVSIAEALSRPDAARWREAIAKEIKALQDNKVYEVVDKDKLDASLNTIDSKFVFRIKADGTYKARLVARGFQQRYGIDYSETFATVAKAESFKILLAVAYAMKKCVRVIDIKTAFLHGELNQPVYLLPPQSSEVWLLHKSLYGLKQAPLEWQTKLHTALINMGFNNLSADTLLYRRGGEYLLVHVDDIFIVSDSAEDVNRLVKAIGARFPLVDHGAKNVNWLGIQVQRTDEGFYLNQTAHIENILDLAGMRDAKAAATPLPTGMKLRKATDEDAITKAPYRQIIGKMIYLLMTRPDIAAAVSFLSQHVGKPTETHWNGLQHLLRYLKGTKKLQLHIGSKQLQLNGFCDSSFGDDLDSRRSQHGYVFFLGTSPITWVSKRQHITALSTTEAEYICIATAGKTAVWIKRLMNELGLDNSEPVQMNVDNQGAIALANNPVHHERTKHIDVMYHRIREWIQDKQIHLKYCTSQENTADVLTKILTPVLHRSAIQKLHLI